MRRFRPINPESKRALRKSKFSWNAGNGAVTPYRRARMRDKRMGEELRDAVRANISLGRLPGLRHFVQAELGAGPNYRRCYKAD